MRLDCLRSADDLAEIGGACPRGAGKTIAIASMLKESFDLL
jgi:hypothetical protein